MWVLLRLKDVWTFTIFHNHDLMRSPVSLSPLFRGHDGPKAELGSSPDLLPSVHVSFHAKFGQDWVLLLTLTAYHFLFRSYIVCEKWTRGVTFLAKAKTSRFAAEMIGQPKEESPEARSLV